MGIMYLLADATMLGWNLTVSKVIAAEIAISNNFLWNDIWTFQGLGAARNAWEYWSSAERGSADRMSSALWSTPGIRSRYSIAATLPAYKAAATVSCL